MRASVHSVAEELLSAVYSLKGNLPCSAWRRSTGSTRCANTAGAAARPAQGNLASWMIGLALLSPLPLLFGGSRGTSQVRAGDMRFGRTKSLQQADGVARLRCHDQKCAATIVLLRSCDIAFNPLLNITRRKKCKQMQGAQPRCRCVRNGHCPGADVSGVGPVSVQKWQQ